MKIAIVCDWLVTYAGSERVLEQMLECFPQADLFAVVDFIPKKERAFIKHKPITTTYIQKLPFAQRYYRHCLPWMPLAIEQLDMSGYDLIISNSHAVAKGILTGPDQTHISYIHSPMRYAWDLQHQYLKESGHEKGLVSWLMRRELHKLRLWDQHTANGVDHFIANSHFIARRIRKTYRREATVIYPPVATDTFPLCITKENFYLTASRLVPYKKIDLIIDSFAAMPDKKLVVIGTGPDSKKIQARLTPNIQWLGYQPTAVLVDYMQRAKAFVFAAEEDFGIVPLEAQACGTPVIAFGKGGALETIRGLDGQNPENQKLDNNEPTGLFFNQQSIPAICQAVQTFEANIHRFNPHACRANAERFSPEKFRKLFTEFVNQNSSVIPEFTAR